LAHLALQGPLPSGSGPWFNGGRKNTSPSSGEGRGRRRRGGGGDDDEEGARAQENANGSLEERKLFLTSWALGGPFRSPGASEIGTGARTIKTAPQEGNERKEAGGEEEKAKERNVFSL